MFGRKATIQRHKLFRRLALSFRAPLQVRVGRFLFD